MPVLLSVTRPGAFVTGPLPPAARARTVTGAPGAPAGRIDAAVDHATGPPRPVSPPRRDTAGAAAPARP
ncbi:hypothetical protein ABZW03_39145, partial [Kitasatospora sp. NPDC004799]